MPNPTYLFHKSAPEGQLFPDLTSELAATLGAEGWVDTPAKLKPVGEGMPTSGEAVPRATPAAMTVGNERPLTSRPMPVPTPADLRFAQLFDDTGAPVHGGMDVGALIELVDSMSREEIVAALEMTGTALPEPPYDLTNDLRTVLTTALRPKMTEDEEQDLDPAQKDETEKSVEGMTEEEREAWLTADTTTKAMMHAVLDERGVTYKARDGREELQEAIRLSFAPKE